MCIKASTFGTNSIQMDILNLLQHQRQIVINCIFIVTNFNCYAVDVPIRAVAAEEEMTASRDNK